MKKEGEKKKTKQLRERHSRNATMGGQKTEQDTVKIEIEKLHKKELAPITKSPSKDLKSHQGPTSRHLSQSMKNTESIKRALESQKKNDELKSTRLQAIDKKLLSPTASKEAVPEVEAKSLQEQAYLKVKLK